MTVVIPGPMLAYTRFMQFWAQHGHGDEVIEMLRKLLNDYYAEVQKERKER